MNEIIVEFALSVIWFLGLGCLAYWTPWLIRKGWIEGESSAVKNKKVCDMCFRDVERYKEFLKNNPT